MVFLIKNISGGVVFECEAASIKAAVQIALRKGADLRSADLGGADLVGADLRSADLVGADLGGAYLRSADLRSADLRSAYLVGAYLGGADLRSADLRSADLRSADLRSADLRSADLRSADLVRADLVGADLGGADLIDAGQDTRGYRFWCWLHKNGHVVYRAGCREWSDHKEAMAHYGEHYGSDGDVDECLARLALMHGIAERRGWLKTENKAA